MLKSRKWMVLAVAATIGAGCSRYGLASGDIGTIDPSDAAKTVVLQAMNVSDESLELRVVAQGQSRFVGSVGARDTTAILLDPALFPAAEFYIVGIGADPSHRAISGPLSAGRGDVVLFRISPDIRSSHAYVTHGSVPR